MSTFTDMPRAEMEKPKGAKMVPNFIDYIKFPEAHEARFNEIMDIIATSIKTGRLHADSGVIELGILPKEAELPYFFFMWVSETNEVIENLNLVLSDLDLLKTGYFIFKESPRVRYTLLIRTFFG